MASVAIIGAGRAWQQQTGAFGSELPQRDVRGGDGLGGQPGPTEARARSAAPRACRCHWVLTEEDVVDLLRIGELARTAGPFELGAAGAAVTLSVVTSTNRKATSVIGFCRP